jgi:uncharacterized protein YjbI with pentapeptide repeats
MDLTFESGQTYVLQFSDFENSRLSGSLRNVDGNRLRTNFEDCVLIEMDFRDLTFDACDFLDTHFFTTVFRQCSLDKTHFNSCFVSSSRFENTQISLTNFTNNTFVDCTFDRCQFNRFVFKNCEFQNCSFINCGTTNRLFDLCVLIDCHFKDMDLQIETVTSNIGLNVHNLDSVYFRTARVYHEHDRLGVDELEPYFRSFEENGMEKISSTYFEFGVCEKFYEELFQLCQDPNWLRHGVSKTAATRLEHLTRFTIGLYDNNKLMLLPIVHLQDFVNDLAEKTGNKEGIMLYPVIQTLQGLRLQLASYTSVFIKNVLCIESSMSGPYRLYCEGVGSLDKYFFEKIFNHIDSRSYHVVEVKPKNSPVEIIINVSDLATLFAIYAAVVATRLRITIEESAKNLEISRKLFSFDHLVEKNNEQTMDYKDVNKKLVNRSLKKLDLILGRIGEAEDEVGVSAIAVFSSGLCQKFELGFSASRAIEIHRHILRVTKITKE